MQTRHICRSVLACIVACASFTAWSSACTYRRWCFSSLSPCCLYSSSYCEQTGYAPNILVIKSFRDVQFCFVVRICFVVLLPGAFWKPHAVFVGQQAALNSMQLCPFLALFTWAHKLTIAMRIVSQHTSLASRLTLGIQIPSCCCPLTKARMHAR